MITQAFRGIYNQSILCIMYHGLWSCFIAPAQYADIKYCYVDATCLFAYNGMVSSTSFCCENLDSHCPIQDLRATCSTKKTIISICHSLRNGRRWIGTILNRILLRIKLAQLPGSHEKQRYFDFGYNITGRLRNGDAVIIAGTYTDVLVWEYISRLLSCHLPL